MIDLRDLRKALLGEAQRTPEFGLDVVATILGVSPLAAHEWITLHGDPVSDPISGVFLANCVSIDGGVLLNTSLGRDELAISNARCRLAEDILLLLLTAMIVFGPHSPNEGPVN